MNLVNHHFVKPSNLTRFIVNEVILTLSRSEIAFVRTASFKLVTEGIVDTFNANASSCSGPPRIKKKKARLAAQPQNKPTPFLQ